MTATQILDWLGYKQGKATKRDIRALFAAWPETGTTCYVHPNSALERAGLPAHRNYSIGCAFQLIGCEVL